MFDLQRKYLLDQQVEFILSGEQNFWGLIGKKSLTWHKKMDGCQISEKSLHLTQISPRIFDAK